MSDETPSVDPEFTAWMEEIREELRAESERRDGHKTRMQELMARWDARGSPWQSRNLTAVATRDFKLDASNDR